MEVMIALASNVSPEVSKHIQKKLSALNLVFPKAGKFLQGVEYTDRLTSEFDRATRKIRLSTAYTRGTVAEAQYGCSKSNPPGFTVHDGEHESFDALIVHEFAHCIHATIAESTADEDDFREYMAALRTLQKALGNPSGYAAKNISEWTAETFTAEWMGKGNGPLIKLFLERLK
jgi:hypothetical protein